MTETAENPLRKWRNSKGLSLEAMCDVFAAWGLEKPSTAKLSRIERDQHIPPDMIPAIEKITGLTARELRPDLAQLFGANHDPAA